MKILPFLKEHMDLFEQSEDDLERYGHFDSNAQVPLMDYGVNFTVLDEGRITLVGGIFQTSIHTGKCWTLVSKHAKNTGHRLLRTVKNQLENMMQDMRLHRVETANLLDAEDHHKWCYLLGFVEEGEMPYYDDQGRTYVRLAKYMEIKEWE